MGSKEGYKHGDKSVNIILGIGIPDLLMNLMPCHGFLENKNSVVLLKFPKSMLEYYFSKGCTLFEWNTINLEKISNEVKDRTHAEDTENSEKVMTFTTTISSTSNTRKNLAVNKVFHSSYIKR